MLKKMTAGWMVWVIVFAWTVPVRADGPVIPMESGREIMAEEPAVSPEAVQAMMGEDQSFVDQQEAVQGAIEGAVVSEPVAQIQPVEAEVPQREAEGDEVDPAMLELFSQMGISLDFSGDPESEALREIAADPGIDELFDVWIREAEMTEYGDLAMRQVPLRDVLAGSNPGPDQQNRVILEEIKKKLGDRLAAYQKAPAGTFTGQELAGLEIEINAIKAMLDDPARRALEDRKKVKEIWAAHQSATQDKIRANLQTAVNLNKTDYMGLQEVRLKGGKYAVSDDQLARAYIAWKQAEYDLNLFGGPIPKK